MAGKQISQTKNIWILLLFVAVFIILTQAYSFGNRTSDHAPPNPPLKVVVRDQQSPILTVNTPESVSALKPTMVQGTELIIRGTVHDEQSDIESLVVNGEPLTLSADGTWSTKIILNSTQLNTITVVASDSYGNKAVAMRYAAVMPVLAAQDTWFSQGEADITKASITEIEILDSYTPSDKVSAIWDASQGKTGSVTAFVEGTKLILAGNGSGTVYTNPDSKWAFSGSGADQFTNLTEFKGGSILNTGLTVTMERMFEGCSQLSYIDVSSWDTSSCENMSFTFAMCSNLKALDVSDFSMSKVTTTRAMFGGCHSLEMLDVSAWDMRNVTTASSMFASSTGNTGAMSLTHLDLRNWETPLLSSMAAMFYGCGHLTSLDLSGLEVSNVTSMTHMLSDCYLLSDVNFNGWDTSSLENMDALFNDCRSLISLDLSAFDTKNVTIFSQIFEGCTSLTTIKGLESWDTSKGITFWEMFRNCSSIQELDLSGFDTRNATDYEYVYQNVTYHATETMFTGMKRLRKITFGPNFTFIGKETNSTPPAMLPTPDSQHIAGATGLWYRLPSFEGFTPEDVPSYCAATYTAIPEYILPTTPAPQSTYPF